MATEQAKGNGESKAKTRRKPTPREAVNAMFDWLEARGLVAVAAKMEPAEFQKPSQLVTAGGAPAAESATGQQVLALFAPPSREPDEAKAKIALRRLRQMGLAPVLDEQPQVAVPKLNLV